MTYEQLQLQANHLTKKDIDRITKAIPKAYMTGYRELSEQIEKYYSKYLETANPSKYFEIMQLRGRQQALERKVGIILTDAHKRASKVVTEATQLAYSNQYYRKQFSHAVVSLTAFKPMRFQALSEDIMKYAATQNETFLKAYSNSIQNKIKKRNYSPRKGTLAELLGSWKTQQARKVQQAVHSGILAGKGSRDMKRDLKKIMVGSSNQILRIARTETNRTLNAGGYASDIRMQDKVPEAKREWVAVLDTNTRQQSAQMDGQKENDDGLFRYPNGATGKYPGTSGIARYDINERCAVVMRAPGVPPKLRRMRDPVTGKNEVITYRNFNSWAKEHGLRYNKSGRLIKSG